MAEITLGDLYQFNKSAMSQIKPLDPIAFNKAINEVASYIVDESVLHDKKYWMLLNNERKDYTVIHPFTVDGMASELAETLTNRGAVLDATKQEDGSYEIWIRDPETDENFVYYLFDYTNGIVEA